MWDVLDSYRATRVGRFGQAGSILIGLVGAALVAGVGYGVWLTVGTTAGLFGGVTTNNGVVIALLIVGLAINLATITDRL